MYAFTWHEPGAGNPFGIRVLDCRPMTWSLVSSTRDPAIAARYLKLRASDGKDLVGAPIADAVTVPASLRFPHNGQPLEGIVFKADGMEVKWDVYIYDSVFLFARSWTGELGFRARASVGATEIHVTEIECPAHDRELAPQHVYFLIGSHAMRSVLPHRVPCQATDDPMTIATASFSLFGRLACYAAFDDITRVPVPAPG
jgi:hypothetical protein